MRRRPILLALAAAAFAVGALAVADRAFPPDLSRYRERSTVVRASDGQVLRAFVTGDGMWRLAATRADVDPVYLDLLKSYEDRRFERHRGIDPLALARALWQATRAGRVVSGGSTLTMQTARLLERRPPGLLGKLWEMARAVQLELRYGKDEILAMYLTLAPFGGNIEGVRAASLSWLGKEPGRLSAAEAALLVALPQSPERLRPDQNPARARSARDKVLARAASAGALGSRTAAEVRAEAVPHERLAMPFLAPQLAERLRAAVPPGREIVTNVDARLQRALEQLARTEARWFADGADVAIVAVESRSRAVRGYVASADFFGPAGQGDLARARRSPGSALKPFVYAFAFDDGTAHPGTLIDDAPTRFGEYAPRNFERDFNGAVTARAALQQSLNVPAILLLDRVGPARFLAELRRAGAELALPRGDDPGSLAIALGGVGVSLSDLVMLYAGLAEGGEARTLAIEAAGAAGEPRRLFGADAARQVADILAGSPPPDGRSAGGIAFKTGTSYGFRDAWAIGFSATHTIGVWVGRADGSPRPGQFGRNTAAPILFKAFDLLPAAARPSAIVAGPPPRGLRHLSGAAGAARLAAVSAPRIVFPPEGATLELAPLALRAEGGTLPIRWIVNGAPVASSPLALDTVWEPDGEGFAQITAQDGAGASASVRVRLVRPR